MHIKKPFVFITALSLSAAMLFSGCGQSGESSQTESSAVETTASATTEATDTASLNPLLWKVTGEKGNTVYLFGTIHAGGIQSDQVMNKLKEKVDSCDALAVEADILTYQMDFERQQKNLLSMMLTDGTTIKDHLSSDNYDKCVKYLTDAGQYNAAFDSYKPSFWSQLITQNEINKSDINTSKAMDTLLLSYASEKSKEVIEVESVEFQIDMTNNFSDTWYNLQFEAFFKEPNATKEGLDKLYKAWLSGDEAQLKELALDETELDDGMTNEQQKAVKEYKKAMYTDRNLGMAEKAERFIKGGKSVFFAVGTAHFMGDDGIVKLLSDKGYTVEKISI